MKKTMPYHPSGRAVVPLSAACPLAGVMDAVLILLVPLLSSDDVMMAEGWIPAG
jgi:hypothetical protein